MKRCLHAFPLLWTVGIGSGALLFACGNGSNGNLRPLGDAGGDGGSDGGCTFSVEVTPDIGISFGQVVPGSSETKPLIVKNMSNCPITLNPLVPQGASAFLFSVAVDSADFTYDYQYTTPIPPNGMVTFAVTLAFPQGWNAYGNVTAYLTVTVNDLPGYFDIGLR